MRLEAEGDGPYGSVGDPRSGPRGRNGSIVSSKPRVVRQRVVEGGMLPTAKVDGQPRLDGLSSGNHGQKDKTRAAYPSSMTQKAATEFVRWWCSQGPGRGSLDLGRGRAAAPAPVRAGSAAECAPRWTEYYCPRDGTRYSRREKCDEERLCPHCVKKWAWREGNVVGARLEGVARKHGLRRKVRHVVISWEWPRDLGVNDACVLDQAFKEAWAELKCMGALGGALVCHPWRHEPGELGTTWYWGLHVHALVWGRIDADLRWPGTFVRTLREEQASEVATFAYLLDHCGIVPRRHAVRWVGVASYNKSPGLAVPKPDREGPFCPECGCLMERVLLIDWTDSGHPVALPAGMGRWE